MTTTTCPTEYTEISCDCGNGPFILVPARQFPHLCLDCAEHADRNVNGWTPENSAD